MIWLPARPGVRSNTLTGGVSPSIVQWYTLAAVTSPISEGESHFQYTTDSFITWLFIFAFSSARGGGR
jgi:hypothetical protein